MASNLSTIGFVFASEQDFEALMSRLAAEAVERLGCGERGDYAIWRSRTGAEVWFHLSAQGRDDPDRHIIGFTPFFEGQSDVTLKATGAVRRPDDNEMEGAFCAWVSPDESGEGAYPIVFDAVDFAAHAERALPIIWHARLTGFARELKAYPDVTAYAATQDNEPGFAAQCFIPMGLFSTAMLDAETSEKVDGDETPPASTALLTGRVLAHELLRNEETGFPFHWLLLESLEATYDIIADPEIVSGEIIVGGTVETSCWMCGRITT